MYESYYGLSAKPFQLKPDPHFFYGSKGHKRAMAYLDYGLSQGEGFIVITGEIGAGKTTLMRNLFARLEPSKIHAAQIVTTHVDSDDILRMVAAAFGLAFEDASKSSLLIRLEQFFRQCHAQSKRALLMVDEAQNLTPRAIEELRMLSNFQTNDASLLQTFLLGQPEFRRTLLSGDLQQLVQRVIASYHLGPLDAEETRAYIDHRLHTVGWRGDPAITADAYVAIHAYSEGIPRRINTLCDRLFLMGYLEELHTFGGQEVASVIADIQQEFHPPMSAEYPSENLASNSENVEGIAPPVPVAQQTEALPVLENMNERLSKMERSVVSILDAVKKIISTPRSRKSSEEEA
ncbi:putative secretion ATPase (PEP-CTERM system associated) [Paucimonas lemoignei]|uniref:Putative secretion ATPase (PEP-CTERM system associated) n=1 Tax=Paucimonas lemoignei TaxID=29443 RepID=A0A4R3I1J1_PAULE|nr:XrtA/PEP-CTERM system-associated ATPase [Paucimonas lemoignei]TCS38571.1 putative secretion ATPase (PEP-CTERM system associated) [Paucimonas lemoignei]